jgi:hypothetical protein
VADEKMKQGFRSETRKKSDSKKLEFPTMLTNLRFTFSERTDLDRCQPIKNGSRHMNCTVDIIRDISGSSCLCRLDQSQRAT